MGLGTLVGRGFVRIDADTKPAEKAIKALGAIGSLGALGALGGAIAPITTATLGLAGAFATAGGAATAFGAAVVPQFQAITKATQQKSTADDQQSKAQLAVAAAQKLAKEGGFKYGQQVQITSKMSAQAKAQAQEYNRALASAQTATKGAAKSQALYKEKLDAMPPATKETALALEKLKDAGKKWSDTLAANTMPIFTKGIQFLQGLLPRLTPMVQSVAGEITFFLDTLGESSAGRIFKEFGRNVTKNGSGALGSFLRIATNVLAGVIGILNAFMPASKGVTGGLEQMTKKFADWSAGLGKSKSFQDFLSRMREEIPKLFTALGQLISVFGKLTVAAGPFAGLSLRIAEAMARLLDSIPMPVLRVLVPTILAVNVAMKAWAIATAINTAVQTVHTAVVRAGGLSTIAMTVAMRAARIAILAWSAATRIAALAWRLLSLAFTASPIGLVITAIIALGVALVIAYNKSATFRKIVQAAFGGVVIAAKAVGAFFSGPFVRFFTVMIPHAFQVTRDWVARNWPWILGALTGPIGLAVVWIIKHWDTVKNFFVTAWGVIKRNSIDPLVHFFTVVIPNAGRAMRDAIMGWVRWLVLKILGVFGSIIDHAVGLGRWVPFLGGKLRDIQRKFDEFKADVNRALGGIKDKRPTVSVGMKIMSGKNAGLVNIGGIARAKGGPIFGPGTSGNVPVRPLQAPRRAVPGVYTRAAAYGPENSPQPLGRAVFGAGIRIPDLTGLRIPNRAAPDLRLMAAVLMIPARLKLMFTAGERLKPMFTAGERQGTRTDLRPNISAPGREGSGNAAARAVGTSALWLAALAQDYAAPGVSGPPLVNGSRRRVPRAAPSGRGPVVLEELTIVHREPISSQRELLAVITDAINQVEAT